MNFIEAMIKLEKNQGYVRRAAWRGNLIKQHIVKHNGTYYHNYDNHYYNFEKVYEFTSVDYLANDWEIYEEERELHTFEKALMALKSGATIKRKDYVIMHKITNYNFLFDKSDILANDWVIIEEEV